MNLCNLRGKAVVVRWIPDHHARLKSGMASIEHLIEGVRDLGPDAIRARIQELDAGDPGTACAAPRRDAGAVPERSAGDRTHDRPHRSLPHDLLDNLVEFVVDPDAEPGNVVPALGSLSSTWQGGSNRPQKRPSNQN